jgi:hypothetical protein
MRVPLFVTFGRVGERVMLRRQRDELNRGGSIERVGSFCC